MRLIMLTFLLGAAASIYPAESREVLRVIQAGKMVVVTNGTVISLDRKSFTMVFPLLTNGGDLYLIPSPTNNNAWKSVAKGLPLEDIDQFSPAKGMAENGREPDPELYMRTIGFHLWYHILGKGGRFHRVTYKGSRYFGYRNVEKLYLDDGQGMAEYSIENYPGREVYICCVYARTVYDPDYNMKTQTEFYRAWFILRFR